MNSEFFERFMDKVSPEPNTGCWLWTGATYHNGYGVMKVAGTRNTTRSRLLTGETYVSIARDYPVGGLAIGRIKRGEAWTHV